MLFTPWLDTFRARTTRRLARRSSQRLSRRESKLPPRAAAVEHLETRTLLTGPGFVSVSPNVGDFIQPGDDLGIAPGELVYQFSPGQDIDPTTLSSIRLFGAGHDGQFSPASTLSDFGTNGGVTLRLGTQRLGTDENGSTLAIQAMDNSGNGPTVAFVAAANEIQQINPGARVTGGDFRLSFGFGPGSTTNPIAFDADAATVQSELEGLTAIDPGDIIVSGGQLPDTPVTVEFTGKFSTTNVAQMSFLGGNLQTNEQQSISLSGNPTGGDFSLSLDDATFGINDTSDPIDFDALAENERQRLTLTGNPNSGDFTLDFNDAGSGINGTTNAINFDDDAAAVQTAILGGIPALAGNIQVTGGDLPSEVVIEFIGTLAATNVAEFTVAANNLTGGGSPAPSIQESLSVLLALESGIPALAGNIQVTGGPLPGSVSVEFQGPFADMNVAEFTVGSNNLSGGTNPAPVIVTDGDGGSPPSGAVTTIQLAVVNTLTLTLDANSSNPTTAQDLLNFVDNDPAAALLLTAELLDGDPTLDIATTIPMGETHTLAGGAAAEAVTDFGTGTDLRVRIIADNGGLDGNDIFLQINRQDRGTISSAPAINVVGNRIEVILNDNALAPTSAADLVSALNSNTASSSLVDASVALGDSLTDISGVQDGTRIQLSNADTLIDPGHIGVINSGNEVVFRPALPLQDDDYRIDILGVGFNPLANVFGEVFQDGADHFLGFTVDLGAQVRATVPQPVLREQILTVLDPAGLTDGDTFTIDPGTGPASFAFDSDDLGTGGALTVDFQAVAAGSAGNGIEVSITKSDLGGPMDPQVTVDRRSITAVLNANAGNESSAQDLIDAVNNHPVAGRLVQASLNDGINEFDLEFDQDIPVTILDTDGEGTGFTDRLPGTGATLPPMDPNLDLQIGNGRLLISSTQADIPFGGTNLDQLEAPGVFLPGIEGQDIEVSAIFRNINVPNLSDQLLLYVGTSATSLVRVGFHEGAIQPQIVAIENQGGADTALMAPDTTAVNTGDDVELTLRRTDGVWELLWDNLTNPASSGSSGPLAIPFLDLETDLYAGILAMNAGTATPFIGEVENFNVTTEDNITTGLTMNASLTLSGGVDLFTFEFNDTDNNATPGGGVRPGNIQVDFTQADLASTIANAIENAIQNTSISSPNVTALQSGDAVVVTGGAFDARVTLITQNSGAASVEAGGLQQRTDLVNVYFNPDELDADLARDPMFYRLFDTNETFDPTDDTILIPTAVDFDPVRHTAVLTFSSPLPDATYTLRVGESFESNSDLLTATQVGNVFAGSPYTTIATIGDEIGVSDDARDDVDLYRLELTAGDSLIVSSMPDGGLNTTLRLFDAGGNEINSGGGFNFSPMGFGGLDMLTYTAQATGAHFIGVSSDGNDAYPTNGDGGLNGGSTGSYQLTVSTNAPFDTNDDNSSFGTATDLGILGAADHRFTASITPQSIPLPPQPGGPDEPGHREIPAETHGPGPGTTATTPGNLGVVTFSFPTVYGVDQQGNPLFNLITEDQKMRAREIFEIYASHFGFEVAEVSAGGIRIVTGDPRAVSPTIPPSAVGGIAGGGLVVMNSFVGGGFTPAESQFGAQWMGIALHEIGHAIGLIHSYDLRSNQGNSPATEDQYPTHHDIIHGRRIHPNNATDIDLYEFTVDEPGLFTAEVVAERLPTSSLLNSALRLYQQDGMTGEPILIAQNDDYFSNDAYVELELLAGTYFIGVSSTGNTDYDPTISDSGFGGTSEGTYDLKLGFTAAASSSLLDVTGTRFDGDLDGEAGGTYEFSFRSATSANDTIFVDKATITNLSSPINATQPTITVDDASVFPSAPGFDIIVESASSSETMTVTQINGNVLTVMRPGGAVSHPINAVVKPANADGTIGLPFGTIRDAFAAAARFDIVRIVGNGGADNDLLTIADARPYEVGLSESFVRLEDGSKFEIPQDVVVQVDAGAVLKLRSAVLDAGTSAVGIDRSGGALQVLGTPGNSVQFTSFNDDSIGGDSNGAGSPAQPGNWGGLVFRNDSDHQDMTAAPDDPGIFLNYVNHADFNYGGGVVNVDSVDSVFTPIHIETTRPTITNNVITNSADAAMSANPNAFDDSRGRIGPFIRGNEVTNNSINGVFVRIETQFGQPIDRLEETARFDDMDIVHVITENLEIVGNPGGPLNFDPRPSGRLKVDPGVVVKLGSARIEGNRGNSHLIAEGTTENPVILTSTLDDRYGAGGSFDTTNNMTAQQAAAGDWGGLMFNAVSRLSVDQSLIAFGGGETPIEGGFGRFNTVELHHGAKGRIANTTFEDNAGGGGGSRNGRGTSTLSTIFVRQAQPILVNNVFRNGEGPVIDINANAMLATVQRDTGRSTGRVDRFTQFADNRGPLIRANRTGNNTINGMVVRGAELTTESVWDDTDIAHVLRDEILVDHHHTRSGLRLQSNPGESLVIKLFGGNAGFTADGIPLDIDDRIGGTVQVIGRPGFPVVMTSFDDCTVGAGLTPDGFPQLFTNNDCTPSVAATPSIIDVVLLLDDTSSFEDAGTTVRDQFPQIIADLQAALPGGDFAFGITRFEEYAGDGSFGGGETELRPFILNQPIIETTTGGFQAAIDDALARTLPPQGSGRDETHIEALFQVATGLGFDGNNDGDVLDSGVAGSVLTQTNPGPGGDVPNYGSLMVDGPVLPPTDPAGLGGVGFRNTSTDRIVLLATDGDFLFRDDGQSTYTGVNGVTVPATAFTDDGSTTPIPNNNAATIQSTVDALVAQGIKVVGLGSAGGFGGGGANTVQQPLEALATLTGATDAGGNPLYFDVAPDNGPLISSAIVAAVTGAVTGLDASAGDWRGLEFHQNSNDRNVRVHLEVEDANNGGIELNDNQGNAEFLGELAPQHRSGPTGNSIAMPEIEPNINAIDTYVRLDGDDNRPLGFEIHGFISADDPGDVDVYSFRAEAGTEVWFDIDDARGGAFDPVLEFLQADGTVLARARYNHTTQQVDLLENFVGTGDADVLEKFNFLGGDFYSTNPYDTGLRVVLPGQAGAVGTYFIRVRSNQATEAQTDDPARLSQGLTSGEYRLQVRLQQVDEKPGSIVQYADIRFATTAILVDGLPKHSPLISENHETTSANGPGQTKQNLGNLLENDKNTINFGGNLSGDTDVDFYLFNSDYAQTKLGPSIQAIGGVNGGDKTWSAVFDLDLADGLQRADTTLTVYQDINGNFTPVLIGRESNVEDDQPAANNANDLDDLSRGSIGKLDPFIGPVHLPTGTPSTLTADFHKYGVAVSSDVLLSRQLEQTFVSNATNQLTRLEPINSVTRIIEDHIGFQGYTSTGAPVLPRNDNATNMVPGGGLFDISDVTTLGTHVYQFDLADVPLFVSRGNSLVNVNALNGQIVDTINNNLGVGNNTVQDIAMRSDGNLFAYQRLQGNGTNAGQLSMFDLLVNGNGNLSTTGLSSDNIGDTTGTGNNTFFDDFTDTDEVGALTWRRTGNSQWELYYAIHEGNNSKLYRATATGSASRSGNNEGFKGDIQPGGSVFSEASLVITGQQGTGVIRIQARDSSTDGDGITVNVSRTANGGPFISVGGNTINVTIDSDNSPVDRVNDIITAINDDPDASQLVSASLQSGSGTAILGNTDGTGLAFATATTAGGGGPQLTGLVTGLAWDEFSNANRLFGVTDAGEFLRIIPNNSNNSQSQRLATTTVVRDFQGLGILAPGEGFTGLTLGPQNLENARYASTFFATTTTGRLLAFDDLGNGIVAFDSNNEVQRIEIAGGATAIGDTFTLTYDDGAQPFTTDPIAFNAPALVSENEAFEIETVAYDGTFTLSYVHDNGYFTSLFDAIDDQATTTMFDVDDASGFGSPSVLNPVVIQVDGEQMHVTNVAGNTLTVVRGTNGVLEAHADDATVAEVLTTVLMEDIGIGETDIDVADATSLPATPFLIRINNEDIRVDMVAGNTLTVTRAVNDTAEDLHFTGDLVSRIQTTAGIDYDADGPTVAAALGLLPGIGGGNIVGMDGPMTGLGLFAGMPANLEFTGTLAGTDIDDLTFDTTGLEGDEIQSFTIPNAITGGTFNLGFGGDTAGPFTLAEPLANIEMALENLPAIMALGASVDLFVTGTIPGTVNVRFNGDVQDTNIATQLTLDSTSLTNNETQRVITTGAPTGGSFLLSFNGTPATIPTAFDADEAGLLASLNSIPALNGNVSVAPGNVSTGLFVEFIAGLADMDVNQLALNANNLTGGTTPSVNITTTVVGDQDGFAFTSRQGQAVDVELNGLVDGVTSVADRLAALPSLAPTDIQVNGGPLPGVPVDITFLSGVDENLMTTRNYFADPMTMATVTEFGLVGDGQADNSIITVAGLGNNTGLAFSPLDFNLWHPTTRRGAPDDQGHGINATFDLSRTPDAESQLIDNPFNPRTHTEDAGGVSFYFGLETWQSGTPTYLEFDDTNAQAGVLDNRIQRDLTGNTNIGNNVNLPAGAYGSLISDAFDLTSTTGTQDRDDRPTLYFNYFLETEDTNSNTPDGSVRDSARVFISNDGGLNWDVLATNNASLSGGVAAGNDTSELPHFQSHSRLANLSDARQQAQPLFDNTGTWRQARVDLSDYTGQTDLILRFDFSTAGTIIDPGVITNDTNPPSTGISLATPTDGFGDLNATSRGQNNTGEGFYIDDIIIGWSERGEMITGATADETQFSVPPAPAALMLPEQLLMGDYQVEIRRGFEFAAPADPTMPEIVINQHFDINTRFIPGSSLGLPPAQDDFDGDGTDPTTLGFDPTLGWVVNSAGSNAPWSVASTGEPPATNLTIGIGAGDAFFLVDDATGFNTGDLIQVDSEPMQIIGILGNLLTVGRGPGAVMHNAGATVEHLNVVAQSGTVDDSERSVMQITQTTTSITFDYRVDADQGDVFQLFVDSFGGVEGPTLQVGDTNGQWIRGVTIDVTPGVHTFFFAYQKDGLDAAGNPLEKLDADEHVFIDNVVFGDLGAVFVRGDRNVERQQGHLHISNNIIRDSAVTGIRVQSVDPMDRDPQTNAGSPGSIINFATQNVERLAPSVAIVNNVIAGFASFGIDIVGDPLTAGDATNPESAVPLAKIINNTIFGTTMQTGTGINVEVNASPTILNNIVASTDTAIAVDGSSSSTVVGRNLFHNNLMVGTAGNNAIIDDPLNPLFVNAGANNFYLADTAEAIDRALGSLPDRANFTSFKSDLGIPNSDAFSPDRDHFNQKRVDDPTQLPSGLGGEVFNDLGAIERADFLGGLARLVVPEDNGTEDLESLPNVVHIDDPDRFNEFIVQLIDNGIGIDDSSVAQFGTQFTLTQQTRSETRVLAQGADYIFAYNNNTNEAILTSVTTFPKDARFTLQVDNSLSSGILDLAGNPLVPNQGDGTVRFDILVTSGANDPPVNTVPGPQMLDENVSTAPTSLTFSADDGNAFSVDDPDAFINTNEVRVTLSVNNGTLTLPQNFATLVTNVTGNGTNSVSFTGDIDDINTLLAGGTLAADKLTYVPNQDFNGTDILTILTNDLGNFSADMPLIPMTDSDMVAITVNPVNSPPSIILQSTTTSVDEDNTLTFNNANSNLVTVSDGLDGDLGGDLSLTLTVTQGILTLNPATGMVPPLASITNDGTASIVLTGSVANINAAINGMTYLPNQDYNGADTLTILFDDAGNTGLGSPLNAMATIDITVDPVNDDPVNSLEGMPIMPGDEVAGIEDTPLVFNAANNSLITVADVDVTEGAGPNVGDLQVTLSVTDASATDDAEIALNPAATAALDFGFNDGFGVGDSDGSDGTLSFRGTPAEINAALDGLTLTPPLDLFGDDVVFLEIVTSDLENSPAPEGTDTDTITIDLAEGNDPPVNSVPGTQMVDEEGTVTVSPDMSISDPDAGGAVVQVTLEADNGFLSLNPAGIAALSFAFNDGNGMGEGDGSDDARMTFRGTIADINTALMGVTYRGGQDFFGTDTVTITTNDLGNSGSPGPFSDVDTFNVTVAPVNDAPDVNGPALIQVQEDTDLVFSAAGSSITITDVDDPTQVGAGLYEVDLVLTPPGGETVGTLHVSGNGSATVTNDGSSAVNIVGSLADINAALDGMIYRPAPGRQFGIDTLQIDVDDRGNTGSGPDMMGSGTIMIEFDGPNDAPVHVAPSNSLSTAEETPLTMTVGAGTAIQVTDVDAATGLLSVTLSAAEPQSQITVDTGTGITNVMNNGTSSVSFDGQLGQINDALDGLIFLPGLNFNGTETLTITTNDNGNMGTGGAKSDSDAFSITVTPVNDEPTISGPAGLTVDESGSVTISSGSGNGILVDDIDLGAGKLKLTLTVSDGTLTLSRTTGLAFTGGANGTSTMTFTGSRTAINAALEGMVYRPTPGFNGSDTLEMLLDDQGNTGSGGALTATRDIPINVLPVNQGPSIQVADPDVGTNEATALVFSTSNMNAIGVSDPDALESTGVVQVSLSVNDGTLSLSTTNNLSFAFSDSNGTGAGNGTMDGNMVFRGPIIDVNVALSGLTYLPDANFSGTDMLEINVNDLGNTGSGGALQDDATVTIDVTPINDPPVNTVPGPQLVNEGSTLTFSSMNMPSNVIQTSDPDAGTNLIEVSLNVDDGALATNGTLGLSFGFTGGDSNGADGSLRFRGNLTAINTALDGLTYTPDMGFSGSDTLTVTTNDLGASGSGGAKSDTDTVDITVNAVNDKPVANNDTYHLLQGATLTTTDLTGADSDSNNDSVLVNDTDADGDSLFAVLDSNPSHHNGAFTLALNGTFSYIHDGSNNFTDSFLYHADDNDLQSDPATVNFVINAVPTITGGTFSIDEHSGAGTAVGSVSASDLNGGDVLSFAIIAGDPNNGFAIDSNGDITVANPAVIDFETSSTFNLTVQVSDNAVAQGVATAGVTVNLNDIAEAIIVNPSDFTNNGITLSRTGSKIQVKDTLTGAVIVPPHEIANVTSLVFNGRDNLNDTLTVDFIGGDPIPGSAVYDGGAGGVDTLAFENGTVNNVTHTFTNGSSGNVNIDGSLLSYTGLEPITDTLDAQSRNFTFSSSADIVTVADIGTGNDSMSRISSAGTSESVDFMTPATLIDVTLGGGNDSLTVTSLDGDFSGSFLVNANAGTDSVDLIGLDVNSTVFGGSGNDVLRGGNGNDFMRGDSGNDIMDGRGGLDRLFGGSGIDRLEGGAGDELNGQGTSFDVNRVNVSGDVVVTTLGPTVTQVTSALGSILLVKSEFFEFVGGSGNDEIDIRAFAGRLATVLGGDGNDTVHGSALNDHLDGGNGDDSILGGNGNDLILLGNGDDYALGDGGSDSINGGEGDDIMLGAADADLFVPGSGIGDFDVVIGGGSNGDRMQVQVQGDVQIQSNRVFTSTGEVFFKRLEGLQLTASDGNDKIDGRLFNGQITVNAGAGNDTVFGTANGDLVFGEGGDDIIDAGNGNNVVDGGNGDDAIRGGSGSDNLIGNFGNDVLLGEAGNDVLIGGANNDLVLGGLGADFVKGNGSKDSLAGGGNGDPLDPLDNIASDAVDVIDNAFSFDFDALLI